MKINYFSLITTCLFLSSQALQQPQSTMLTDDTLQKIILADLESLSGKELNEEIKRLPKVNRQYYRVMHRPAVTQRIIIKKLKAMPTKKKFDDMITYLSQNPDYKKEFDSKIVKDFIKNKNHIFDVIATQIQPKIDEEMEPTIDIVNGENGINTVSRGKTVLSWALDFELEPDFIKLLLDNGANPNFSESKNTHSPLAFAIGYTTNKINRFIITQLLLDAGANPNYIYSSDELIHSPLIEAATAGDLDIIKLLLEYGADPLLSFKGHTQLDWVKNAQEKLNKPDKEIREEINSFLENVEKEYREKQAQKKSSK